MAMRVCALIAMTCCAAQTWCAQPAGLERVFRDAHEKGVFDGVALVAQHGRVLVEIPLGYADAQRGALSVRHRFNIGSVGKEFSAVAIMRLAESGKLQLDMPVSRLLDGYPPWADAVTIRMLLDYTSGLPEMRWRAVKSDADARDDLRRVGSTSFAPGTDYAYTYNNVMLRQFIVEQLTGKPFDDTMRAILKRCRMRDSRVDPPPDEPRVARSYSDDFSPDPTDMPVTGIVFVTARDLYGWSQCLNSGRVISRDSSFVLGQSYRADNGGLGETRWDGRTLLRHVHQGESRNYEALLRYDARLDSTIVLLSNHKQQQLDAIAARAEAILDGKN